jgi:hypothetical protein
MFIGFAPRALTAAIIGIASGTISHVLFRYWSTLGLPDGEAISITFLQNGFAVVLVVGAYMLHEISMGAGRTAFKQYQ